MSRYRNTFFNNSDKFISAGVEIRNVVYKGNVNERGYDGVFKLGVRKEEFHADIFYENFKIIEYAYFGVNLNYVLKPVKKLTSSIGIELGIIQRPKHLYPSIAAISELDYHLGSFFIYIVGQIKVRPDINEKIKGSVYGGLGYKLKLGEKYFLYP